MTSYSKRVDLLYDQQEALRQLQQASTDDRPPSVRSVRSPDRKGGVRRLADMLNDKQIREIIDAFQTGVAKRKLAAKYGISESSIKRLLRKYRG